MSTRKISGSIRLVAEGKEDAALLCHTLHALPALGQVAGVTIVFASSRLECWKKYFVYLMVVEEV